MTQVAKGIAAGIASLVVLFVLGGLFAVWVARSPVPKPAPPKPTPKPIPRPESTAEERVLAEFIELHNELRRSHYTNALTRSPELMVSAKMETDCNARKGKLAHECDGSPWERMEQAGYKMSVGAENIAYTPCGSQDYDALHESMVEAFRMLSLEPFHRANILKRSVTQIGVALTVRGGYAYYCTDFGAPGTWSFAAAPVTPVVGSGGFTSSVSTEP